MRPFEPEILAFKHHWRSLGRADSTFEHYAERLRKWHDETGRLAPTLAETRRYVLALEETEGRWSAYWSVRALKSFARFLADEADEPNALAKLRIPDMGTPLKTPTARADEIDALLAVCSGSDVWSRRDHALISILRSTGMRRSELARVRFDDLDLENGRLLIPKTKNHEPRTVRLTEDARRSIRLYLRALEAFEDRCCRDTDHPEMWVSKRRMPLSSNGIQKVLQSRSREAGVHVPAHAFRRAFAVEFLAKGGTEAYLMRLAGWKHGDMVRRYTNSVATEEALRMHERLFG